MHLEKTDETVKKNIYKNPEAVASINKPQIMCKLPDL